MSGLIDITDAEFESISKLVYEKFGINLTEKKRMLVRGRLHKRLLQMGHNNFQSYYDWIVQDTTGIGLLELVDKISTNHTMFFRESDHFL
ncbi:MAG: chemotaxis protein CheR, partial [Spirochaetota bacterium]|nr:chemotaxis protein CheR [Spirochaetota bacterium]